MGRDGLLSGQQLVSPRRRRRPEPRPAGLVVLGNGGRTAGPSKLLTHTLAPQQCPWLAFIILDIGA